MTWRAIGLTALVGLALVGCSPQNAPTLELPAETPTATTDDTLLSADAGALTSALTQEFRDAQALALAWRSDAVLVAHTVQFPPTLARGKAKRVYVFGSPTQTAEWWTVTINETTAERVRALIPREDYLEPTLPPAPLEFWKLNSVEALQKADVAGGQAFRQANPGAEATATLMQKGPNNWLWWVVTYRGASGDPLSVRIHPKSGELYGEDGRPITSPSPTATETETVK